MNDELPLSPRLQKFKNAGLLGCLNGSGVTSENYKEKIMKELPIEPYANPCLVYAMRDPTEKDTNYPFTVWISKEYTPHRVFMGEEGKWEFVGKFYPEKNS